ncbi:MAG TPA: hypothetical protein VI977_05015 [archaeon]|nr:hypothetical protein [archaeon]
MWKENKIEHSELWKSATNKIVESLEKTVQILESEKDPWRSYAYKRWAEEGEDAEKLFKF